MPKYEKHHKHDHRFDNDRKSEPQMDEDEEVKWNPTPEILDAFYKRDAELCATNLRLVFASRQAFSLKELKDSTLHSSETVDRQVTAWVQEGVVQESKGRYSLVQVARGQ